MGKNQRGTERIGSNFSKKESAGEAVNLEGRARLGIDEIIGSTVKEMGGQIISERSMGKIQQRRGGKEDMASTLKSHQNYLKRTRNRGEKYVGIRISLGGKKTPSISASPAEPPGKEGDQIKVTGIRGSVHIRDSSTSTKKSIRSA